MRTLGNALRRCYGASPKEFNISTHNTLASASKRQPIAASSSTSGRPRRDHLRAMLLANVDLLYRRRAGQIGDSTIDEYIALQWFEWNGGGLRLTVVGQNICEQIRAETPETIE